MYGDRRIMKGLMFCLDCKQYHERHLICPQKRVRLDREEEQIAAAEAAEAATEVEPLEIAVQGELEEVHIYTEDGEQTLDLSPDVVSEVFDVVDDAAADGGFFAEEAEEIKDAVEDAVDAPKAKRGKKKK